MASRFQATILSASPTHPNAIAWSDENLVAVASGHSITILNPTMPCGPRCVFTIPTCKPFPIGVIERNDLLSNCLLPTCLSREIRPCVRSISWSPLGLAPNSGCLLAVCTTEALVKIYRSPFREISSEWVEVMDVSEMLHMYLAKIRYGEADASSSDNCPEVDDDEPIANFGIRRQKRQKTAHDPSIISAEKYASRSAMISSLVVSWSPMLHSNNSSRSCSILAIGAKSGRISLWKVPEPQCYSITQSKPPVASLIGFIKAHDSLITAISWSKSKLESNGSCQLLLATGCSDGSVKLWRGYSDDLMKSSDENHASFSLLKEVVNVGSGPTSALSLIVPEDSPNKIMLAVGKGSGSLIISTYDMSLDKFDVFDPHYAHDQVVTGLVWAYGGRCLYSCSQDNSLRSWIVNGDSLHEVALPSNILGDNTSPEVPNASDACFGIAVSPANLVIAAVRSYDINLLDPMYQARSHKAVVEFFWIGGQNLGNFVNKDSESNDGILHNKDLVNWGRNILWSLSQFENLDKPLVTWDILTALSAFKMTNLDFVQERLIKWLTLNLGFEWGPSLRIMLQHVSKHLSNLTSRQLHLLNVVNRHVMIKEAKFVDENGKEQGPDEEEKNLWITLLETSEKEVRERIISCIFLATLNKGNNGNWRPVGLTQMRQWVANNNHVVKDYVKQVSSQVKKIEKKYVVEDECSYCSAGVPFQDVEVAYCEGDRCGNRIDEKLKLVRCAVTMTVCPCSPLWLCVSCNRQASHLAPESFFKLTRYPPSEKKAQEGSSNGEILLKPMCPFCGILLQRWQPNCLLSTTPV